MQQRQDQGQGQPEPFTFSTKDDRSRHNNATADGSPVTFIDASANTLGDGNALDETWGTGDHDKYKKYKKKRDKRAKYRNLEQYELDKEDEEQRRKAYEAELTRKEDARRAREDLKRKEIEQEERDRLEAEQKLVERNERDRKDREDEEKAREDARKAAKETRRKIRDEEQRAEEERLMRQKAMKPYSNSPTPHHRRNTYEPDSEEQYFNELAGISQYQQYLYANDEVDFFFNPKFKTYSSEESVYESEQTVEVPAAIPQQKPKYTKPQLDLQKESKKPKLDLQKESKKQKKGKKERKQQKKQEKKEIPPPVARNSDIDESGSGSEAPPIAKNSDLDESGSGSEAKPSSESSFLSGYEQSSFDSNSVSSESSLTSSLSSSSSSSNKSNSVSSESSSEESSVRFSSVSTERTPSVFNSAHSEQNELYFQQTPLHGASHSEMVVHHYNEEVLHMWHEHQNNHNDLLPEEQDSSFVRWYKSEKKLIDQREEKAKQAVIHAKQQAQLADARIAHAEHRSQLAESRLAMLDREAYDAERRLEDLKKQGKDASSKLRDIERRAKEADRRQDSHERQMLEAESRWAQQEKQIIDNETDHQREKRAAIKAEQRSLEVERRAIAEEAMTAHYESLFQREEQSSKQDQIRSIRNQRATFEKLFPLSLEQSYNHPSRTEFPDLRKIPGTSYDPSIIPPFKGQTEEPKTSQDKKSEKKSLKELLDEQKQQIDKKIGGKEEDVKQTIKQDSQKFKKAVEQDSKKLEEKLQEDARQAQVTSKEDQKQARETQEQAERKAEQDLKTVKEEMGVDRSKVEESLRKTREQLDEEAKKVTRQASQDRRELEKKFDQTQKSTRQAVDKGKEKVEERLKREQEAIKAREQQQEAAKEKKDQEKASEESDRKKQPEIREQKPFEAVKQPDQKEKSIWERITSPFSHDSDSEQKQDPQKKDQKQPAPSKPLSKTQGQEKPQEKADAKQEDQRSAWEKLTDPVIARPLAPKTAEKSDEEKDQKEPIKKKVVEPREPEKKEEKPWWDFDFGFASDRQQPREDIQPTQGKTQDKPELDHRQPRREQERTQTKQGPSQSKTKSKSKSQGRRTQVDVDIEVTRTFDVEQQRAQQDRRRQQREAQQQKDKQPPKVESQKTDMKQDEKSWWEKFSFGTDGKREEKPKHDQPQISAPASAQQQEQTRTEGRQQPEVKVQQPTFEIPKVQQPKEQEQGQQRGREVFARESYRERQSRRQMEEKQDQDKSWLDQFSFGSDDKREQKSKQQDQSDKQGSFQSPQQEQKKTDAKQLPEVKVQQPIFEMPKDQKPKEQHQQKQRDREVVEQESYLERQSRKQMEKKQDQDKSWWEKLGFDKDEKTQPQKTESERQGSKEVSKSPTRRTEVDIDIDIEMRTATKTQKQTAPVVQQQQPMFGQGKQRAQQEKTMQEKTESEKLARQTQAKADEKSWWEKYGTSSEPQTEQKPQKSIPVSIDREIPVQKSPDVKIESPVFEMAKDRQQQPQKREVVQESYRERQSRKQMEEAKARDTQYERVVGTDKRKEQLKPQDKTLPETKKAVVSPIEPFAKPGVKQASQRQEQGQTQPIQDRKQGQKPDTRRSFEPAKTFKEDEQGWSPYTQQPEAYKAYPLKSKREAESEEGQGWRPFAADKPAQSKTEFTASFEVGKQADRRPTERLQKPQPAASDSRYDRRPQEKESPRMTRDMQYQTQDRRERPITGVLEDQKQYGAQRRAKKLTERQPQKQAKPSHKLVPAFTDFVRPSLSEKTTGQLAHASLPAHDEDKQLKGEKVYPWDTHYSHHQQTKHNLAEQDRSLYMNEQEKQDSMPIPRDKEVKSLQKTFDSLDKQSQKLQQDRLDKEEKGSRMVEYAEMARRKFMAPAANLESDNRFSAEALQNYRAQERELEMWKSQEDAELKEEYQIKLAEMRQEYHEKLADIDRSYHEKERSLEHEHAKLERDLAEAREDIELYGDEIDEVVEYGMILPDQISGFGHASPVPIMAPVQLSEKMEEEPTDQPQHPVHTHIPGSPIHTFNNMQDVYQNLASRQVPNGPQNSDPLADIKRREREIQKERDYREHELRMEYEKRLEEFEADYRLKEQELEKEKLHQEKRLIAEREKEIDADRKRVLEEAFGTDSIDLGAGQSDYGAEDAVDEYGDEANWSEESYEPESSENDGNVELDWDLELAPKRREKPRTKDSHHKRTSEREHKSHKSHRHQADNSSEEENHGHHHASKHHHKKHSSHKSKSDHKKKSKHHKKHHESKSHKKHHHHHNEVEFDLSGGLDQENLATKSHHLSLKIPQDREQPVYHKGITTEVNEADYETVKNAAKDFGSHLLNLREPENTEQANGPKGKKSKRSKKKGKKSKGKDGEGKKGDQKAKQEWAATRAHLELEQPLTPIDIHWREAIPHVTDLDDADFEYHVKEHARMHELEGYEADHHLDETDLEMIEYAHDLDEETPIESLTYHWSDFPVVPVHHAKPKVKPAKEAKEEPEKETKEELAKEAKEEQPSEEVAEEELAPTKETEQEEKRPVKKEKSRYRMTPERVEQGDEEELEDGQVPIKSHKKGKKSKKERKAEERYGKMMEHPERYYSHYGFQRPMMPEMPWEHMYDGPHADWYSPTPYWGHHGYHEPHGMEHMASMTYPGYMPQPYYTPLRRPSPYPSVHPHSESRPVHFAAEHPTAHPVKEHPTAHQVKEDPPVHAAPDKPKPALSKPEQQKKTFGLDVTVKDKPDPDGEGSKVGEKYHFEVQSDKSPSIRLPKPDTQQPPQLFAIPKDQPERMPGKAPVETEKEQVQKPKSEQAKPIGSPVQPKQQPLVQLSKPAQLTPTVPEDKSDEFQKGYKTGYERGIEAEREILMKEFAQKYQLTDSEQVMEKQPEKSSKKNDYHDRYHHGRNDLYESPRPHKIAQGQQQSETVSKTPQAPLEKSAELSQVIWEKPHQELLKNNEEVSDAEEQSETQLVPMQDQYGHKYFVPYHDPDFLSKEGYFEEHMQPIIQFVPVIYDGSTMVIEQPQEEQQTSQEDSDDDLGSVLEEIYEDLDYILKKEYGESLFQDEATSSAANANSLSNYFSELVERDYRLQNSYRPNSNRRDQLLQYLLS